MRAQAPATPQVVAYMLYPKSGKANLVKPVQQHLNLSPGKALFVEINGEVTLTSVPQGIPVQVKKRSFALPPEAAAALALRSGDRIAFIERPDQSLALKRAVLIEQEAEFARYKQYETARQLTTVVETNQMPEAWIERHRKQFTRYRLKHCPAAFFSGKESFFAYFGRRLLDRPDRGDERLRQSLVDERIKSQLPNGSWQDHIVLTARRLRELTALGCTAAEAPVRHAADWLLQRPESVYNPGMFFGSDDLIQVQAQVIALRKAGGHERFRQLRTSEKKRIRAGDDLIENPCGPRIMWPNALVLEALLQAGFEEHPRVQKILRFICMNDWCECAYQNGSQGLRHRPVTEEELLEIEASCTSSYRFGGVTSPKDALMYPRQSQARTEDGWVYELAMPDHIQGCEFITTRALARAKDPFARRFARAHLWRFAGVQRGATGEFPPERHGTGFNQAGILEAFARCPLPISHAVI